MLVRECVFNCEEIIRINKLSVNCLFVIWFVYWVKLMDSLWVCVGFNKKKKLL